jgi:segregation and condensation protein A
MAETEAISPQISKLLLSLDGFEGPLDLLLELAKGEKIDLSRISIVSLVEQYLAVIEGARQIRLELAADWLVMAAWLAWLKSRLLLPDGEELEEGELAADTLASRLRDLQAMREAAAWLGARPVLGRDVFARAEAENLTEIDRSRLALDSAGLSRAYLTAVRRTMGKRRYRPAEVNIWTVKDALARLERLLGTLPDWSTLELFLPPDLTSGRERRAATASTLLAGLELARSGVLRLRQEVTFGPILIGLMGEVQMPEIHLTEVQNA